MSLTPISELRPVTNPLIVHQLGVRLVQCQLTGFLCKRFAALPVASKADSTKVSWRGAFVDYESALAYANALIETNQLSSEQFEVIKAQVTRKLGFLPTIPAVDINKLYPRGDMMPETYLQSYLSTTSIMDKDLFPVPAEKIKTEKPARYEGFEVSSDKKGALTIDSTKPAFSVQGVSQMLVPWESDPEQAAAHCYSWLVTLDGARPPHKCTVTEYATPKQAEQFHGKPGDKKGTKIRALVLRNAKQQQPKSESTAETTNVPTKTKRVKKEAEADAPKPTVAKKRKVATA